MLGKSVNLKLFHSSVWKPQEEDRPFRPPYLLRCARTCRCPLFFY